MSYTCHVISHTHWDREWYLTFERFRLRLVDLIDRLLDLMEADPGFRYFNLDGQGIILEDYLKIRPENEERLRALISQGRITIGPWYVLNDEFLVSGESTVRSLLLGHKVVGRFGPVMKVGYLPDQFGNISQMPQILRGFGIDNCIFGRGLQLSGDRKMEFVWQSPDGSEVLTSLMALWYNNAQHIPTASDGAAAMVDGLVKAMGPRSASSHLLFMNGVDHLEAQYDLSEALNSLKDSPHTVIHSRLPDYVDALRGDPGASKLETVRGELREDRGGSILAGVLSSRIYLKQANERCMRLLEKYAEPASLWAMCAKMKYPQGELEYAWKLLMENHPHDSICGCSTDEVHSEMTARFARVEQLAQELRDRALAHIANRVKVEGLALVVFNTLSWDRTDVVRATIDVPLGDPDRTDPSQDKARDWPALEILSPAGETVPFTLLSSQKVARPEIHPEKLPMVQWVRRFEVEFIAQDVPAMGFSAYRLQRAAKHPTPSRGVSDQCRGCLSLSSGTLEISLDADDFCVAWESGEDEASYLEHISSLEDSGDVGDEYNYRKPDRDIRITGEGALRQTRVNYISEVSGELELRYRLDLPESATPGQQARSERAAVCPVSVKARLYEGVPRIEFETLIQNNAKDHRLRALFCSDAEGATHSVAGSAFDVVERPLHIPEDWDRAATFHPMDGWVDVSNGEKGLAVFVDGLREYELHDDPGRTLAITLLRSVGILSGTGDIPHVQRVPDAQCLGEHSARYAVYPHTGDWKQGKVWKEALNYQAPMVAVQVGDLDRARSIEPVEKKMPLQMSFVRITPDTLCPSALKKTESGSAVVVRFWNVLEERVDGEVTVRCGKKAWRANLLEERLEELPVDEGRIPVSAGPREIVTLIVEP